MKFLFLCCLFCAVPTALANKVEDVLQEFSVLDYTGQTVTLQTPAKRIVALAPHIVENLYSAGAGHHIVGTTDYADYPAEASQIPRVGLAQGISVESIIALKPDLVVAWYSGSSSKKLKMLSDANIPIYMDEPREIEHIAKSIRDFGVLANTSETANASAQQFLDDLAGLEKKYVYADTDLSVFYQVWNSPLQTINKKSIINSVIELCGAKNIFSNAQVIAPLVSIESVINLNPDAIVTSSKNNHLPDSLRQWQKWKSITAVKNNNLFFVHPDLLLRQTVRLLEGARIVCEKLDAVRAKL